MHISLKKLFSNTIFITIIFFCLGLIIYSQSFHSRLQFDDSYYIIDNNSIKNISNLGAAWRFYPARFLALVTFSLNYHFHGLNVFGYHLVNFLIHIITSLLAWWLTILTLSSPLMHNDKIKTNSNSIAFFVGLIFLTHPLQTEGVIYITQRFTSLATLFYLASLGLYVKSRLLLYNNKNKNSNMAFRFYVFSLITIVMGMFTKEITMTLPLMIILYEFCFFREKKGNIAWKYTIPFLITFIIAPLTMCLVKSVSIKGLYNMAKQDLQVNSLEYLLTQFRVMVTYLRLLFIPINQNLDYDYSIYRSIFDLPVLTSALLLLVIIILAIKAFSKYRLVSFGIFWFFLTLLPESSILPLRDIIFEHRLYLPMLGFSIFLVSSIYYLFGAKTQKPMFIILFVLINCYSILTHNRNLIWKDQFTLWNDTVSKSPNKPRPYHNRGSFFQDKGELDLALSDYDKAIELDPNFANSYVNRGSIYQEKGNSEQALADYNKTIQLDYNLAEVYVNRGGLFHDKGEFDQALFDYSKAIEIDSDCAKAYSNRGNTYHAKDNLKQAFTDYNKAIGIDPKLAKAYNNRGVAYHDIGKLEQALADFNQAIKIDPKYVEAYVNRGLVYQDKGELEKALSDYNKAIEMNPNLAEAYNNRAIVYFFKQEYDKSWEDLHKAEQLGYKVHTEFIEELKKVSGRQK